MSAKLDLLSQNLQKHLGERAANIRCALGEVSIDVDVCDYLDTMVQLRDEPELRFEQLIDLCGMDYSAYGSDGWQGNRFAVVSHLT